MSFVGEFLLRNIAQRRHTKYQNQEDTKPAQACSNETSDNAFLKNTHRNYIQWQYESSENIFNTFPDFDVRGKTVLDIGCGTGGRTAYLASLGAKKVVGIDINKEELEIAQDNCADLYPQVKGKISFCVSEEDELLDLGQFDIAVLIDAMEHVVSPPKMMRLAHSYIKPDGRFYY